MYLVVLLLGMLIVAAGAVTALFGFSIKEFSVGSTMLISGTTAIVGGLVLIALAAAIRELRRIADAVSRRQPPRFPRVPEPPPGVRPGVGAPPIPPMPPAPPHGHHDIPPSPPARPVEPRPTAEQPEPESAVPEPTTIAEAISQPAEPDAQPSLGQQRTAQAGAEPAAVSSVEPAAAASPAFEPPQVAEPDAIPLSPEEESQPPRDQVAQAETADDYGPSAEHDAEPEPIEPAAAEETHASAQEPPPSDESVLRFDDIWPEDEPPLRRRSNEAAPDSRSAEAMSDGEENIGHGAASAPEEAAVAGGEPEREGDVHLVPEPEPPRAISILKSGVIDGMAYALYSDGSIEAELASGIIRFASIEELRAHLEKTG